MTQHATMMALYHQLPHAAMYHQMNPGMVAAVAPTVVSVTSDHYNQQQQPHQPYQASSSSTGSSGTLTTASQHISPPQSFAVQSHSSSSFTCNSSSGEIYSNLPPKKESKDNSAELYSNLTGQKAPKTSQVDSYSNLPPKKLPKDLSIHGYTGLTLSVTTGELSAATTSTISTTAPGLPSETNVDVKSLSSIKENSQPETYNSNQEEQKEDGGNRFTTREKLTKCSLCHSTIRIMDEPWRHLQNDFSSTTFCNLLELVKKVLKEGNKSSKLIKTSIICMSCFTLLDRVDELQEQIKVSLSLQNLFSKIIFWYFIIKI